MSGQARAQATSTGAAGRTRPRTIPRKAREHPTSDAGGTACCDYFVGRRKVARVDHHATGAVSIR